MARDIERDHVISQGTLRSGAARIDYYTTNPAPEQWVAIGVVSTLPGRPKPRTGRRLLVGNGESELGCILDLQAQFLQFAVDSDYSSRHDREIASATGFRTHPTRSNDDAPENPAHPSRDEAREMQH